MYSFKTELNSLQAKRIPLYLFLVLFWLGLTSIWGCSSSSQKLRSEKAENRNQNKELSPDDINTEQIAVDIYAVGGDDWTSTYNPEIPLISNNIVINQLQNTNKSSNLNNNPAPDEIKKIRMVQGYRVQLVNVVDEAAANLVQESAKAHFDSVYIIYQRPNYKVRAGDFLKRSMADAAADTAKAYGFEDAWVVPSKVYDLPLKISVE